MTFKPNFRGVKSYRSSSTPIGSIFYICLVIGIFLFFIVASVNSRPTPEAVKSAVENQNYTNVSDCACHYWGSQLVYGCGESDMWACTVSATNVSGKRVQLIVCKGWLKGFTIRTR